MASKKTLVIVESPAKANTINKYLGKEYVVKASLGHVKDLPKSKLGVDIENDFEPTYVESPGKDKVIKELRAAAKTADRIFLAADPDREGEAICQHLKEILETKKSNIFRVMFNEITPKAIKAAVANPGLINQSVVDAQQARRILDRIVGYQVSPLLWDKVRRGISAGRVQTVALRLIVEREQEILAFKPEEYWSVTAKLEGHQPPPFEAKLAKIKGKTASVTNQAEADHILASLKSATFNVDSVVTKEKKRYPVPPFTTSKLQQEAARKLRFTVKKTMMLAQRLYEGIEVGGLEPAAGAEGEGEGGRVGLITYMRTDSPRISDDAMQMVRSYVSDVYSDKYLPEKPIIYKGKKDAQDAHEAIRPTFVGRTPDDLKSMLSDDEYKLYKLIWTRFTASQMNPAIYDQTSAEITAGDYMFRASGRVLKFDGFLKVYEETADEDAKPAEDEEDITLPLLTQGETLKALEINPKQHFTEPPPRFTEASLVKTLEEKGIGRPSTYATILTTIQDREYVHKDQGKFRPTELGTVVTTMLVRHFEEIFDIQYTARMEEELDEVEDGKITWVQALRDFYKKFEKDLKKATKNMENLKAQELPTNEICEKCGGPMVQKWGQFGSFLACAAYPECKSTREIAKEENAPKEGAAGAEAEPEPCENCGKPMALKRGRFGQFLACTGYPECKTTRKISSSGGAPKKPDVILEEICPQCREAKLVVKDGRYGAFTSCGNYPKCKYIKPNLVGVSCPKPGCGGELSERRTKRGKTFYGCVKYPDCDFVTWNKPVKEQCPQCGSPYLLEKSTKKEGLVHYCNEETCDYKISVEKEGAEGVLTP